MKTTNGKQIATAHLDTIEAMVDAKDHAALLAAYQAARAALENVDFDAWYCIGRTGMLYRILNTAPGLVCSRDPWFRCRADIAAARRYIAA